MKVINSSNTGSGNKTAFNCALVDVAGNALACYLIPVTNQMTGDKGASQQPQAT